MKMTGPRGKVPEEQGGYAMIGVSGAIRILSPGRQACCGAGANNHGIPCKAGLPSPSAKCNNYRKKTNMSRSRR
jgi:hypothetical protein